MQLLKCQLKAFVCVVCTEREGNILAKLLNGVSNYATILELARPAESGKLTTFALLLTTMSFLQNVNCDSVNVNIRVIIHVVVSLRSKNIWVNPQVDSLATFQQ